MPKAYYNEIDLYCAGWLYELQKANLIAPGDIDTRPIQDVRPNDLKGYTQAHFFAGLGGWSRALRQAGYSDRREVWTGSCPCQPFSLAGKRAGFADERHLWPYWRYLVAVERPAIVFGEQVASASEWLRLVRGDLEALDYAVGAIPIEAASEGADHLRDRYWFVGHAASDGRSEGWTEHELRSGRNAAASNGRSINMADAIGQRGCCRYDLRQDAAHAYTSSEGSMANPDLLLEGDGGLQRSRQLGGPGGNPQARDSSTVAHAASQRRNRRENPTGQAGWHVTQSNGEHDVSMHVSDQSVRLPIVSYTHQYGVSDSQRQSNACGYMPYSRDEFEWVLGADGKARRVKPGIRLLAHGVPNRVAKLRAFGNAIDPRPAAAFIKASCEALSIPLDSP